MCACKVCVLRVFSIVRACRNRASGFQELRLAVSNDPSKASDVSLSHNPLPDEVKAIRESAGLPQMQAGVMVHITCRAWQQWEAGGRRMHPAFCDLFRRKIAAKPPLPLAKKFDMTTQQATARRAAAAAPTPLTPAQRVLYAAAMADTKAVFALEDMMPSPKDKAITEAIVAGLAAPEQAREELHAYVLEHKTVRGFIDSRAWAVR